MPDLRASHRLSAIGLLLLMALELAIFWSVTSEFLTPDAIFYLARPLKDWSDFRGVFSRLDDRDNYRPLTYVIAAPLYWWAGLEPFPYHLFTLTFHALITALVFWFGRLILRSERGALTAALFFGLHRSASHVAFGITFLPDVTYAAFYVFGLIAFLKYERMSAPAWYAVSLLSFCASLLCKEPAVTFPAVLLLSLALVPGLSLRAGGGRLRWGQAFVRTLPFWALAALYVGWFGILSHGRFIPQDPNHPYGVSFSLNTLLNKRPYVEWALFWTNFGTMGEHPAISAMAKRFLPPSVAGEFSQVSDLYLYLIGPLWLVWLILSGKYYYFYRFFVAALWTPIMALILAALAGKLLSSRRSPDKTAWFGLLFFVLALAPVLFLAHKTMIHNLYVPVAGLAMVLGYLVRELRNGRVGSWERVLAASIPTALLVGGMLSIARHLNEEWPVVSSRRARAYLADVQQLYPKLSADTVLYFERTGDPDWPWFTEGGNLYRLYYREANLLTLFGDRGEEVPIGTGRTLVRLREKNGRLVPSF